MMISWYADAMIEKSERKQSNALRGIPTKEVILPGSPIYTSLSSLFRIWKTFYQFYKILKQFNISLPPPFFFYLFLLLWEPSSFVNGFKQVFSIIAEYKIWKGDKFISISQLGNLIEDLTKGSIVLLPVSDTASPAEGITRVRTFPVFRAGLLFAKSSKEKYQSTNVKCFQQT